MPACRRSSRPCSVARRCDLRRRGRRRRRRRRPGRRPRRGSPRPARPCRGASTGTRAARHSPATSGAQSHHSDGSAATSTPARWPAARRPRTRRRSPRRRACRAPAGGSPSRRWTSPWICTRSGASTSWAASTSSCGPLCGVGRAEEADRQRALVDAAGRCGRGRRAPRPLLGGHRLADDVERVGRIALVDQRAAHAVRDRQAGGDPARERLADRRQAVLVGLGSGAVAADAGGAVGRRRRPGRRRGCCRRATGRRAGRPASSCGW